MSGTWSPGPGASTGDDVFDGTAGADSASGLAGADTLLGLLGNDTLVGGDGNDSVSGGDGADSLGSTGNFQTNLYGGDDTLDGGEGNDTLVDLLGNNLFLGGTGDDRITPGSGNDTIHGGDGRDRLVFLATAPALVVDLGAGTASGQGNDSFTGIEDVTGGGGNDTLLGDTLDNSLDGGGGDDSLSGGDGNDTLTGGSAGSDHLSGGLGNDSLNGGAGRDFETLDGGEGDDTLFDSSGLALMLGGDGDDSITGGCAEDTIFGGIGNDTINGGTGNDTIDGGAGADSINAGAGEDTVLGGDDNDTIIGGADSLADLLQGGNGNDSITVSSPNTAAAETMEGGAGADTLAGSNGDDRLDGGDGVDLLVYSGANNLNLRVDLGAESASGLWGNDTLVSIENVWLNNTSNDTVIGSAVANRLEVGTGFDSAQGGDGADTIFGGDNSDTIDGGAGNDVLLGGTGTDAVGQSGDMVSFASAPGPVSGALAENEKPSGSNNVATSIFTQGADADTVGGFMHVTGSAFDDTLTGNSGDNSLQGGAGNDVLDGGAGIDTVAYRDASGAVSVDLGAGTSSGADGVDAIANVENAVGSAFGDTLIAGESGAAQSDGLITGSRLDGLAGDDSLMGAGLRDDLRGGEGNDTLAAGAEADSLRPGSGNDSVDGGANPVFDLEGNIRGYRDAYDAVVYDDATGGVLIDLGAGTTDGAGGQDTLVGIEEAFGSSHADTLIGGEGDDAVRGGSGDDTADGGNGNDWLSYLGNTTAVLADLGAGTSIGAGADSFANFENLMGGGAADTLIGDDGDNIIDGWRGNDSLVGGGGIDTADFRSADGAVQVTLVDGAGIATVNGPTVSNDTLTGFENVYGGVFADTIGGDTNANFLSGGAGNDQLAGGDGADTLHGGSGDDLLDGGNGADSLFGANGADTLLGGDGDDTIDAGNTNDLVEGGSGNDVLTVSGGGNTVLGGDGDDIVNVIGSPSNGDTLDGGDGIDTLTYEQPGLYRISNAGGTFTIEFLGADTNTVVATDNFVNFENFDYNGDAPFDLGTLGDGNDVTLQVCFAAGTRILTATGEVAVEKLQPGDRVVTLAGRGLPVKPVLWVGRRHVVLAGRADAAEMAPIRIKAGALGANTPKRDLVVSPDHCLYLDGALVPARLLVNGQSVVAEIGMAEVTWYHVELETHEVLVAEGAAAESWLDCGNRSWFQNAPVALLTVPGNLDAVGTGWDASRACAPLVHGGDQLARIRAALEARAEQPAEAAQPTRLAL